MKKNRFYNELDKNKNHHHYTQWADGIYRKST